MEEPAEGIEDIHTEYTKDISFNNVRTVERTNKYM